MSDNIRTDAIELLCTKDDFFELMNDNANLCEKVERLQAENERLREAIEYAFENAANSFLGVNFSFDAVKKLRAALEDSDDQEPHPDHCLCDDCVTLENMDERIELSRQLEVDDA